MVFGLKSAGVKGWKVKKEEANILGIWMRGEGEEEGGKAKR